MEFRRRTLLPLDDVMGCLRESIPKLSRSSLHRCLLRHGISRLPASDIKTTTRGKFAPTEIGYVHIDCGGQVFSDTSIGRLSCRFMLESIG